MQMRETGPREDARILKYRQNKDNVRQRESSVQMENDPGNQGGDSGAEALEDGPGQEGPGGPALGLLHRRGVVLGDTDVLCLPLCALETPSPQSLAPS